MPWDNLPESLWQKMDDCVEQVKGEGKDEEAAIRICYASLAEKSALTAAPVYAPELVDEVVSIYGDPVKAAPTAEGIHLGGYLVRFGDPAHTDLVGDYFTKATDFGDLTTSTVWLNHRMPVKTKRGTITYDKPLVNKATLTLDEIGVYADVLLTAREEYEAQIAQAGLKGALSWSSGTASHLVDRKRIKEGVNEITRWPLGLDASLTPSPAEFRQENRIIPIKSLPTLALADATSDNQKETTMDVNEEIKTAVAAALAEKEAQARAEAVKAAELKAAEEKGYQAAISEIKAGKAPAFNRITEPGFSEEKDAVPAFKHWLQTGQVNGALIRPDSVMENIQSAKAAWNVTTGASGAFLVPDPLYATIIAKRNLASWVRQAPVQLFQTDSDHLLVPVEDTSHTAFVQTAEAVAYDENEGTVAQKDLILYKYTKMEKVNEEFLMSQRTNWEAWLTNALARAEAVTENTIFTNGSGTGEPEGIMTNATASSVTITTSAKLDYIDLAATIGKLGAGYNVPSECGFLMANASKWYLKSSVLAGPYAFQGTPTPVDFYGYPAYVSDDVQAYTATSGKVFGFGNFNFYGVIEKPGMVIQRNPYLYMATGQIGIFASIFRGGVLLQREAFYYTNGK